jgi:hypothetical protein
MPDNFETTLQELRQRITTEGLPKLSAEALRSYKRQERRGPGLAQPTRPQAFAQSVPRSIPSVPREN